VFFLLFGLYAFGTRSHIEEFIQHRQKRGDVKQALLLNLSSKVQAAVGTWSDNDKLDSILRLAEYPWGLNANTYPGTMFALVMIGVVIGAVMWASGSGTPLMIIILPLVFWGAPRVLIYHKADQNRLLLRVSMFDFYARLEQAVAGGVAPERVFERAAEGRGLLAQEVGIVMNAVKYGTPIHQAFIEHFGEKLEIPEAGEIGTVLRNATVMGVPLSGPIKELNKEFRSRRQMDLYLRASKIKPVVDMVLTLTAMLTVIIIIVAPLVINLWMSSMGGGGITGPGF
jgi:Flp pilus assembly protein TadB